MATAEIPAGVNPAKTPEALSFSVRVRFVRVLTGSSVHRT
jgi:hypothetical protein